MVQQIIRRTNTTWKELDSFFKELEANLNNFKPGPDKKIDFYTATDRLNKTLGSLLDESETTLVQLINKMKHTLESMDSQLDFSRVQMHLATMDGKDEIGKFIDRANGITRDLSRFVLLTDGEIAKRLSSFQESFAFFKDNLAQLYRSEQLSKPTHV